MPEQPEQGEERPLLSRRLSVFPLGGAILFPRMRLPLHIFEPRYRAMIADAMARDQRIGMIQPRDAAETPALFQIGCIGRVADIEALENGCYNIVLEGESRFRLIRELDVSTPFRQVLALPMTAEEDEPGSLSATERAALEMSARAFAERLGYLIDWDQVGRLDDETLVHAIGQVAPLDIAAKQAVLELDSLSERTGMLIQIMQYFSPRSDGPATLQ